ncbi:hypothetical protein JTB14_025117 [Gonioctena quinquepunctata]|nr:hypothetical protein JTB14_025117 [Gonioctena quinquepunctata]
MKSGEKCFLVGIFTICALCRDCLSLKEVRVDVPAAVIRGHDAILKCFFDTEGDKLYSVKWYHESAEFYRFAPSKIHPIKQFNIKGFNVNEDKSNATQVTLEHVTSSMSGKFSCEVTVDQPSFYTDMKTASLQVVDPPENNMSITGAKARYKLGDYLKATCTAGRSDPAVNLTWHRNGRPVEAHQVHKYKKNIEGNYTSSYSTIRFKIVEPLFENGLLKLRCSASLMNVWFRSAEKSIHLKKEKHQDPFEDFEPAWVPSTTSTDFSDENYWMYVKNSPESTLIFDANPNSVGKSVLINEAMITVTFIFSINYR